VYDLCSVAIKLAWHRQWHASVQETTESNYEVLSILLIAAIRWTGESVWLVTTRCYGVTPAVLKVGTSAPVDICDHGGALAKSGRLSEVLRGDMGQLQEKDDEAIFCHVPLKKSTKQGDDDCKLEQTWKKMSNWLLLQLFDFILLILGAVFTELSTSYVWRPLLRPLNYDLI